MTKVGPALAAATIGLCQSIAIATPVHADNVLAEWTTVKVPSPPDIKPVTVEPKRTALLLFE